MTNKMKNVPELRFPEFIEEWEEKRLGEVTIYKNGGSFENSVKNHGIFKLITLKSVNTEGELINSGKYIDDKSTETLCKGTLVMILSEQAPGLVGMTANITRNNKYVLNQRVAALVPKQGIDSQFLSKLINRNQKYFSVRSAGTKVKNISKGHVENFNFLSPNYTEQQKIGSFFSKLDRQIELGEQKLEKLEEQKKGYMQKIFSQELRFKNKNGNEYPEWGVIKLKDILSERKEYASKIGNYPHATLSTSGISLKSDRYNRDFLVKDKNKKYKVTIMNDICYNPANLKFGVITRNHIGSVIFSPIYITFEVNNAHSPLFIELLVTRNDFINRVRKYEEGTVYERMAVKPEDFLNYETKIPCLEEQEKIGDFFSKLDKVINKQRQKIDELKLRKQGLLQKMFV
ncbi:MULTISPECIES: restriction endonuclease subunit S [unclassified Staphylococcus]|uniref:restriction endonuclease subunit S n=1 Tax=unclassified Staphylococcus TaxID=91994 RepID=UPI0019504621|nr:MULTISPECIES: restriction endonuclease subunit S [unclassified Staphylococcus]